MISIPSSRRYYLYKESTDMRKSFNGLCGLVNNEMDKDLMKGDAFIFVNKRRTMIKVLIWDRTGFLIYYKKLSSGSFELPVNGLDCSHQELSMATLMMILEGVELKGIKMRKRYLKKDKKCA